MFGGREKSENTLLVIASRCSFSIHMRMAIVGSGYVQTVLYSFAAAIKTLCNVDFDWASRKLPLSKPFATIMNSTYSQRIQMTRQSVLISTRAYTHIT